MLINGKKISYQALFLIVLILASVMLRFVNLGYSEFQGDEIRTFFTGGSFWEFLLSQKKGPAQFVISYVVKLIAGDRNEFAARLPFAIFGLSSVIIVYFLVKELYGKISAAFAALIFSFNGFFVAFSRITQYQSLNFFLYLLAAYMSVLFYKRKNKKYLYFMSFFYALSFLTHYDAAFVSLFILYFVLKHFFEERVGLKHLFLAGALFFGIVGAFYIPFVLSPNFQGTTSSYFFMRLSGEDAGNKSTNVLVTFLLYNPIFTLYFLSFFFAAGFFFGRLKILPLYLWFVPAFVLLGFISSIPGTHIYNFILPAILISSYGIAYLYHEVKKSVFKYPFILSMLCVIGFFFYQSFVLFVDHSVEYPWFEKKVLGITVSMPSKKNHLSLFGFPYNRRLKEVAQYIKGMDDVDLIRSNENTRILRHYIKTAPTNPQPSRYVYIYVLGAQSLAEKKSAKVSDTKPEFVIRRGDQDIVEVYRIGKND